MSAFPAPTMPIISGEAVFSFLFETAPSQWVDGDSPLAHQVKQIIARVRQGGDEALSVILEELGDAPFLKLTPEDIQAAYERLPVSTLETLNQAHHRIDAFAGALKKALGPVHLDHGDFAVGMTYRPVQRAGCYVPGGRFPLPSTALMTVTTAKVAGVPEIVLVSPRLCDEVIVAGHLAGANAFYQLGGAQAIAALALGTETIQAVDVIAGPGNAYVTEAKRQLQGTVGIDMLAGPSEVGIIADAQANPRWVAMDLLAQAEHDPMARAYLMTDSVSLAQAVQQAMVTLMGEVDLPGFLAESIQESAILVLDSLEQCAEVANQIAPEHLQLNIGDPPCLRPLLLNYGALFVGYRATVPFGDYMAGPNHTLPTGRTARFCGGLTPLTFLRPQSWTEVPAGGGRRLAQETADFATLEGLHGHAAAARLRAQQDS